MKILKVIKIQKSRNILKLKFEINQSKLVIYIINSVLL
ncbi:hypothetical protein AM1_5432 [Acaryochloris marina MBIC11017]|uniref:Uncharacterized protein n=1 Tax=Acaryochloris marina (strain MBIC 11017) TaxID=329726 RepID=B0CCU6_ACAM1|nr:hypothetical protein AM1_5432 [Acaryochloris marina MBIC11017]